MIARGFALACLASLLFATPAAADPACAGVPGASACADYYASCVDNDCADCVALFVNQVRVLGRCVSSPTDPQELVEGGKAAVEDAMRKANVLPYVVDCEHTQTNCVPPLP